MVAKTQEAFLFFKNQFKNHSVEKVYNAVVWGNFSDDKLEGVISKPIGRSASDFRKWSAEYGAKGELREAVTEYKVLTQTHNAPALALRMLEIASSPLYIKRGKDKKGSENFSYLEVKPKTGRTHQIRVHLKSISHPVVCDKLYAPNKVCDKKSCLGFDRLALHAVSIKLELPNHTHITIESSLPKEFENAKKFVEITYP